MDAAELFRALDERIAKYDLLSHPFYRAWSAGKMSRSELREYAQHYYHHLQAFPSHLAALGLRLEDGELRRVVLSNMCDEKGVEDRQGRASVPHAELWLDFAEGMGSTRNLDWHYPVEEIRQLVAYFQQVASEGLPEEALAAFYAYESQVPRIAKEKNQGLHGAYGADHKTCGYFWLHATADLYHARVWREQLGKRVAENPAVAEKALDAAEKTAHMLWRAMDGIQGHRFVAA